MWARAMTANEFRRKKLSELETLLEKLASLEESGLQPELKELLSRSCLRQIERITGILDNPALARLCAGAPDRLRAGADSAQTTSHAAKKLAYGPAHARPCEHLRPRRARHPARRATVTAHRSARDVAEVL